MSISICIMGASGAGKTTSLRNLPPAETIYIDCDKKGLSWKGWRENFCDANKNYFKTDDPAQILRWINTISKERPNVHYIVIDTLNGIMWGEDNRKRKEKGYDKFVDLAGNVYDILEAANMLRDDIFVIMTAHTEEETDSGYVFTHIKTCGKKLGKIIPESKINCVLHAKRNEEGFYVFETHAHNSTAKTPLGMFDEEEITNDITIVLEEFKKY